MHILNDFLACFSPFLLERTMVDMRWYKSVIDVPEGLTVAAPPFFSFAFPNYSVILVQKSADLLQPASFVSIKFMSV